MLKLVQLTEISGRDFAGNPITAVILVNVERLVAVKPFDKDKSVLVMQGAAPINVMETPNEVIVRTRLFAPPVIAGL